MNKESSTGVGTLKDAAERVVNARRSDKDALWIAGAAAGISVILLGESLGAPWAIIVIAVAFGLAYRISKIVLYRLRGLGWLPILGNLLPHTVSASTPAQPAAAEPQQPRSAQVARLSFARTWPAAWIVTAPSAGVVTLRGGCGGKHDDMPLGVFMFTERGLAFLPEARDKLEQLIGDIPAAIVTQVAGVVFEPIEKIEAWKDTFELMEHPPTVAEWMEKALAQKNAFAISWSDLTSVIVGQTHTVLTRRTADGAEDNFIILDASPSWPGVMMQRRLVADLKDVVFAKILRPKYDELLPAVRRELSGRSEAEIEGETSRRAMAWYKEAAPTMEKIVRDSMAETLEGYSWLPNVVANQPWLFEKKPQGSA